MKKYILGFSFISVIIFSFGCENSNNTEYPANSGTNEFITQSNLTPLEKTCLTKDAEQISEASYNVCNAPCESRSKDTSTLSVAISTYKAGALTGERQEIVLRSAAIVCQALQFVPARVNEKLQQLKNDLQKTQDTDNACILQSMHGAEKNPVLNSGTLTYLCKMGSVCGTDEANRDPDLHAELIKQYMDMAKIGNPQFDYNQSLSQLNSCMEKFIGNFWIEN